MTGCEMPTEEFVASWRPPDILGGESGGRAEVKKAWAKTQIQVQPSQYNHFSPLLTESESKWDQKRSLRSDQKPDSTAVVTKGQLVAVNHHSLSSEECINC